MDTTLSMRDRLYMRYRYFNDFRHGISVLVNFSLLYWVPPIMPPLLPIICHHCEIYFTIHR